MIAAAAALLALVLLAGSLNSLQFEPGQPVGLDQLFPNPGDTSASTGLGELLLKIFRILMMIAWLVLPLFILYLIISKEGRKKFLRDLAIYLPFLLLLYYLSTRPKGALPMVEAPLVERATLDLSVLEGTPVPAAPEFIPPPNWVTTAATLAIALGIALVFVGVMVVLWRRSHAKAEPLKQVAQEAQSAIRAIEAGGDVREVIMRCYYQMLEALKQYRSIQRGQDITPHEFELVLEQRGLPHEPVHQLTQLFEQVRYGGGAPGRQDERAAINSLGAIVSACERMRS